MNCRFILSITARYMCYNMFFYIVSERTGSVVASAQSGAQIVSDG